MLCGTPTPHPPGAAVRQVILTVEASVARWTGTGEGGHVVSTGARATGAAQTLIHVQGTGRASKASEAGAGKGAHAVLAGTAIEARVCSEQEGSLVIPYAHVSLLCPHVRRPSFC
uniref:Uncharacterized protein n=1 Tax=Peromyscus maniculatus bairdii TaxID=230844 RepID=A0A8C8W2T0_PERMB